MIEPIGERIAVEVLFQPGRMLPRSFSWRRRLYRVAEITSNWNVPEGQFRRYYFTVTTEQPNVYELMFSTKNMQWELTGIYHD